MGGLATTMSIAGGISSAYGQEAQGRAAQAQYNASAQNEKVSAEFEAKQADYLAGQAKAVSQIEAYQQRKTAALLASKALANAAGSGAGTSDPTVVDLISQIYAEGAYRSALAVYEGEEQARSYNISAAARRLGGQSAYNARTAEGQNIRNASQLSMFSSLLKGGSSFLDRYGDNFSKAPSPAGLGESSVTATYGAGPFAGYGWGS